MKFSANCERRTRINSCKILFLFFSLVLLASLAAQEGNGTPAVLGADGTIESSADIKPHAISDKVADAKTTESLSAPESAATSTEAVPSASADVSPEATAASSPDVSPDTSSSMVPTDPSMIPPPDTATSNTESSTAAPASEEGAQPAATPAMPSTESIEKKKQELKVRYYEVRTQVEKEKDVSILKAKADQATTDEGKRQALRAYYELLFTTMKKVDPSISEHCDMMQGAYLRRLEQTSLQPTIPLSPPPTIEKSKNNESAPTSLPKASKKS